MIRFRRAALAPPVPCVFALPRRVRFQDVDAAQIIFYPRVLEYFHDAYVAWLEAGGFDFAGAINSRRWGAPITHAEVFFLKPMRHGDDVSIEIVGGRVAETEASIAYRILGRGVMLAHGQTQHVTIDLAAFRRASMPADVRAVFDGLPALPFDDT